MITRSPTNYPVSYTKLLSHLFAQHVIRLRGKHSSICYMGRYRLYKFYTTMKYR